MHNGKHPNTRYLYRVCEETNFSIDRVVIEILFAFLPFDSATNEDEMCNFYLMYYVDNGDPMDMKYCFSPGPPDYYWRNPENNLQNIPETEASRLD